jgi:hypothetical protein
MQPDGDATERTRRPGEGSRPVGNGSNRRGRTRRRVPDVDDQVNALVVLSIAQDLRAYALMNLVSMIYSTVERGVLVLHFAPLLGGRPRLTTAVRSAPERAFASRTRARIASRSSDRDAARRVAIFIAAAPSSAASAASARRDCESPAQAPTMLSRERGRAASLTFVEAGLRLRIASWRRLAGRDAAVWRRRRGESSRIPKSSAVPWRLSSPSPRRDP